MSEFSGNKYPQRAWEFGALPPIQSEMRGIHGTPEGYVKADWGAEVVDVETGKHYQKRSGPDLNTGWCLVITECDVEEILGRYLPT